MNQMVPINGNDQMLGPPLDPPPIFNKFLVSCTLKLSLQLN